MQRVKEVLEDLFSRVEALGDQRSDNYIRSDEFEDLLDQTRRQVANERHESKRRLYAAILAGAIEKPAASPYHEQLRMLRTIEELQPDHLQVLRAMLQTPERPKRATGSFSGVTTLPQRLPGIPSERLMELVIQLTEELRVITKGTDIVTRIPWLGA